MDLATVMRWRADRPRWTSADAAESWRRTLALPAARRLSPANFQQALVAADVALCLLGFLFAGHWLAWPLAGLGTPLAVLGQAALAGGMALGCVLGLSRLGGYAGAGLHRPAQAVGAAVLAGSVALALAALLTALALPAEAAPPAAFWALWWAASLVPLGLARAQLPALVETGLRQGWLGRSLVVVMPPNDDPAADAALIAALEAPGQGFPCRVVGLLHDAAFSPQASPTDAVLSSYDLAELRALALAGRIDTILLAPPADGANPPGGTPANTEEWVRKVLRQLQPVPTEIAAIRPGAADLRGPGLAALRAAPRGLALPARRALGPTNRRVAGRRGWRDDRAPRFGRLAVRSLARPPFSGLQQAMKWSIDKLVAGTALVVLLPLMLLVAVAVRLESPGPALFRQTRLGHLGRPYQILKFRTMTLDDGDDGTRRMHQKHRITRLGRMLRNSSIDELPQLINVLRGEMSIVGPRPHVPQETVGEYRYLDLEPDYLARLRVKPGLTGWATVNGSRGGIFTREKARRAVELDEYYLAHASVWLDLRIMVRTAFYLFGGDVR